MDLERSHREDRYHLGEKPASPGRFLMETIIFWVITMTAGNIGYRLYKEDIDIAIEDWATTIREEVTSVVEDIIEPKIKTPEERQKVEPEPPVDTKTVARLE